ncbi:MAG: hypothetical protein QOJ29_5470, partial [Thermoleophilaceae bacterium]|nr:hypothetical protein [Thermoleophilaceae bacterium]
MKRRVSMVSSSSCARCSLALITALVVLALTAIAGVESSRSAGYSSVAQASTSAKSKIRGSGRCAKYKRGQRRARRCRRHNERSLPTLDVTRTQVVAPSAPRQGKDPDLLAPWEPGVKLVAGGNCGDVEGQGAHRDYGGKWTDDRYAIDFGVCGKTDYG